MVDAVNTVQTSRARSESQRDGIAPQPQHEVLATAQMQRPLFPVVAELRLGSQAFARTPIDGAAGTLTTRVE